MKRVNLREQPVEMAELLILMQAGPVMLITPDGKEYLVAEADDFEQEVEQLRASVAFQAFLDERQAQRRSRRPLAEVAHEIETELATEASADASTPSRRS